MNRYKFLIEISAKQDAAIIGDAIYGLLFRLESIGNVTVMTVNDKLKPDRDVYISNTTMQHKIEIDTEKAVAFVTHINSGI